MTEKSGTVSVITRTRDRPALLRRALESVLNQTFADWRHIIVNDGGDAEALEKILAEYADRYTGRLTVVHNATSHGMQGASNDGLAKADGVYVAIHDDDDEWNPEFLAATVAFLDEKGPESVYQGVITHTVRVLEDIDAQGQILEVGREPYLPAREVNLFKIGYENPFPPIAFLYRRKVHEIIGEFDPRFDFAGDMDFNVHFLMRWEIGVIQRPLAFYHWRRNSAQAGFENSVTSRANDHVVKFNEFLNHYLRLQAGGDDKNIGLALNIGRHTVTASENSRAALERIDDQNNRLTDFKAHMDSLTGALSGDAVPRLADLKAHLESLGGILESISHTQALSENSARDIKAHLDSLTGALSGDAVPRLADLKAHLESLGGILESISRTQALSENSARDIKLHLNSLTGALSGDAVPRLADLKAHLESLGGMFQMILKSVEETAMRETDVISRVEGLRERLETLERRSRQADDSDAALVDAFRSLREEIAVLREEERAREAEHAKGLRIGGLWLRWRKKGEV